MTSKEKTLLSRHKFYLEWRIKRLKESVDFNDIKWVEEEHPNCYPSRSGAFKAMVRGANNEMEKAIENLEELNETLEDLLKPTEDE